jgi:hypothetical protein
MNAPFRLLDLIAPRGPAPRLSVALVRAFRVHLAALALPAIIVLGPPWVSAAPADGEHPGPGEKIVRSTVGTTPQTLTGPERAKLAAAAAVAQAPAQVSTPRPAPWLPPGWRAQFMNGGTAPTRTAGLRPDPHRVAHVSGAARDIAGRPAHVTPSGAKPPAVRTIGSGPRDASQAEIDSKRAATRRPNGGR